MSIVSHASRSLKAKDIDIIHISTTADPTDDNEDCKPSTRCSLLKYPASTNSLRGAGLGVRLESSDGVSRALLEAVEEEALASVEGLRRVDTKVCRLKGLGRGGRSK